jgi:hypothetical protein
MSVIDAWIRKCDEVNLPIVVDHKGIVHVRNVITQDANCGVQILRGTFPPKKGVCINCRELPGREKHYNEVVSRG